MRTIFKLRHDQKMPDKLMEILNQIEGSKILPGGIALAQGPKGEWLGLVDNSDAIYFIDAGSTEPTEGALRSHLARNREDVQ
jgi:hypothetical protein